MAKIHGVPGEWARVQGSVISLWPLFLSTAAIGFSLAMIFLSSFSKTGMVFLFLAIIGMGVGYVWAMKRIVNFFKGARGEERVSGILRGLPDGYHVFNDYCVGRQHIDHVVVGPAGVFSIETKNWSGKITIEEGYILLNGKLPTRSPLNQALKESMHVKSHLTKLGWNGDVTPVIAFASNTFDARVAELKGSVVMNSNELLSAFSTKRVVIPQSELDRLVALLENEQ
jgi:hypothetical protein